MMVFHLFACYFHTFNVIVLWHVPLKNVFQDFSDCVEVLNVLYFAREIGIRIFCTSRRKRDNLSLQPDALQF